MPIAHENPYGSIFRTVAKIYKLIRKLLIITFYVPMELTSCKFM